MGQHYAALLDALKPRSADTEVTALSPEDEAQFQAWVAANRHAPGVGSYDAPEAHYDMRGFFADKAALAKWKPGDHFPDTYKQHGHQTFSIESKYSQGPWDGGTWNEDNYIPQMTPVR